MTIDRLGAVNECSCVLVTRVLGGIRVNWFALFVQSSANEKSELIGDAKVSYPAHRKKRIEARLQHITDAADLKRSHAELAVLRKVLQSNNPYCLDCVFDCVRCSWINESTPLTV